MQRNSEKILFGILTVSDRCYKNEAVDESGPALKKILDARCGNAFKTEVMLCVPDDITTIERVLRMWSDEKMLHVILTTGGTGPAPRDVTPEATQNVIEKKLPGMALAMAKGSLEKTPMAMLSRAICGIRNQTLIINLPGSKKGCTECLEFVIQSIPHAVGLIRNWVIEVSQTHHLLQTIDGVKNEKSETFSKDMLNESTLKETKNISFPECIHKKTSKVDTSLVARRLRSSPYPMIRFEESLKILDNVVKEMPKISKSVAIRDAFGLVSSEKIFAKYNLPPFPASIKDGYAVKVSDGSGLRKVVADSIAGSEPGKRILKDGECVRINTGAPVPEGADAVVQVEDTELIAEDDDGRKEISINILIPPTVNQDIRPVGSDLKKGQIISSNNGIPLSSQDLALFAAAGVQNIQVFKE
uniref:MoaB/Mog domain-containing protein n=2 Tax=Clastoptera arizonana TaxID=38151 RepID=A0A1B6EFW7_9HEMI